MDDLHVVFQIQIHLAMWCDGLGFYEVYFPGSFAIYPLLGWKAEGRE